MILTAKIIKTSITSISLLSLRKPSDKSMPVVQISMDTEVAEYITSLVDRDQELKICDGCRFLSPTEDQQNKSTAKNPHMCSYYGRRVHHYGYHPNLVRPEDCIKHHIKESSNT